MGQDIFLVCGNKFTNFVRVVIPLYSSPFPDVHTFDFVTQNWSLLMTGK
jgi:hypothetical protein